MQDDLVVLRTYNNEPEARIAAAVLEANGIECGVSGDVAGGALPSLALVFPVRLIVHEIDAQFARELLDTAVEPPTEDKEQGD